MSSKFRTPEETRIWFFRICILSIGLAAFINNGLELLFRSSPGPIPWISFLSGIFFMTVLPQLTPRFISLQRLAPVLVLGGIPLVAAAIFAHAGIRSPMVMWYCVLPVYAELFTTKRVTVVCGTLTLAAMGLMTYAEGIDLWGVTARYTEVPLWHEVIVTLTTFSNIAVSAYFVLIQKHSEKDLEKEFADIRREIGTARALRDMASALAHQTNSPLATIQLLAESAQNSPLDSKNSATLAGAIQRIRDINQALLLMTDVASTEDLNLPQPLTAAVTLAMKSFELTTENPGFRPKVDVPSDIFVEGDAVRPLARFLWRVLKTLDRSIQKQRLQEGSIFHSGTDLCVSLPGFRPEATDQAELMHLQAFLRSIGSDLKIEPGQTLVLRGSFAHMLAQAKPDQTSQAPSGQTAVS